MSKMISEQAGQLLLLFTSELFSLVVMLVIGLTRTLRALPTNVIVGTLSFTNLVFNVLQILLIIVDHNISGSHARWIPAVQYSLRLFPWTFLWAQMAILAWDRFKAVSEPLREISRRQLTVKLVTANYLLTSSVTFVWLTSVLSLQTAQEKIELERNESIDEKSGDEDDDFKTWKSIFTSSSNSSRVSNETIDLPVELVRDSLRATVATFVYIFGVAAYIILTAKLLDLLRKRREKVPSHCVIRQLQESDTLKEMALAATHSFRVLVITTFVFTCSDPKPHHPHTPEVIYEAGTKGLPNTLHSQKGTNIPSRLTIKAALHSADIIIRKRSSKTAAAYLHKRSRDEKIQAKKRQTEIKIAKKSTFIIITLFVAGIPYFLFSLGLAPSHSAALIDFICVSPTLLAVILLAFTNGQFRVAARTLALKGVKRVIGNKRNVRVTNSEELNTVKRSNSDTEPSARPEGNQPSLEPYS